MLIDHVSLLDATERLAATVVAGAAIGFDRNKGGHPAGLGTTLLVCLAASLSMLEANLLLPTAGKTLSSFGQLDYMRLPLGILTGMGFLGAGAILRQGNRISGLTTAATLWVTTVIGLCLGGGQLALGAAATLICILVGVAAKRAEALMTEDQTAELVIEASNAAGILGVIEAHLRDQRFEIVGIAETRSLEACRYHMAVRWRSQETTIKPPTFLAEMSRREDVLRISWRPANAPPSEGSAS